ncbi:hypothetical protein KC19_1G304300 [Ceratodon purpureus]|uniref:Uncharacterized protein n=1 Tax=Ceratodon purpureus TaxID=3225 RepID=A0A8T0JB05_CERPU|nr:hypothetical protein KC19_1G304300 [Ceratodon purpureus]
MSVVIMSHLFILGSCPRLRRLWKSLYKINSVVLMMLPRNIILSIIKQKRSAIQCVTYTNMKGGVGTNKR